MILFCYFIVFADDLKLFVKINSITYFKHFNDDLNEIVLWEFIPWECH